MGDLEQLGIELTVRFVVESDREQAGDRLCRSAFSRFRLEWSTRRGCEAETGPNRGRQPIVDQAEGHRFVEALAGQKIANRRLDTLAHAAAGAGQWDGPVFRDVFVAVNSRDFLDQVDLAFQVAAPGGRPER